MQNTRVSNLVYNLWDAEIEEEQIGEDRTSFILISRRLTEKAHANMGVTQQPVCVGPVCWGSLLL